MDTNRSFRLVLAGLLIIIMILIVLIEINQSKQDIPWHLKYIDVQGAWNITEGGNENITLAIIDSGIDFTHPDLDHSQWFNDDEISDNNVDDDGNGYIDDFHGWDFVSSDNCPGPEINDPIHWHGTFIAGLVAAKKSSKENLAIGIAYNVKLMDLRILNQYNFKEDTGGTELADAIHYAIDNGADVISLSFSALKISSSWIEAIEEAVVKDIPVIAPTGNTVENDVGMGKGIVKYPAALNSVISVGAINYAKEKADYSNYGDNLELVAPAGDLHAPDDELLTSTYLGGIYAFSPGTSFACVQVAAVIALMKSINAHLSVNQTRVILHKTASDLGTLGWDNHFGYGLVNASAAVQEAQGVVIE